MNAYPERIIEAVHHTEIDYGSLRYAMLPAWFVIYEHKGKHNTILVNGETGKVVCGVPWNRKILYSLYFLFATALSCGAVYMINTFLTESDWDFDDIYNAILFLVILIGISFAWGIKMFKKVHKSLGLTQGRSVYNFVKRGREQV